MSPTINLRDLLIIPIEDTRAAAERFMNEHSDNVWKKQ